MDKTPSTITKNKNQCGACSFLFDSRSIPVYCVQCVKWFHKTNCYRGHKCQGPSSVPTHPPSISVPSSPSPQSSSSNAHRVISSTQSPTSSFNNSVTTSTPSVPSRSAPLSTPAQLSTLPAAYRAPSDDHAQPVVSHTTGSVSV